MDDDVGNVWEDAPSSGTGSASSLFAEPAYVPPPVTDDHTEHIKPLEEDFNSLHVGEQTQQTELFAAPAVPILPSLPSVTHYETHLPAEPIKATLDLDNPFLRMPAAQPQPPSNAFSALPSPITPGGFKKAERGVVLSGDPLGGTGSTNDTSEPTAPSSNTDDSNGDLDTADAGQFEISVGEPTKVGDALNPYIVYKVRTRTTHTAYRNPEFSVNRRFRDFLWLHQQLLPKYPGVIIPPVPEKHAIGRFEQDFVESRRAALERFVRKVAVHRVLQDDVDLRIFLESETFIADVNQRKKEESKGFMRVLGDTFSGATPSTKMQEFDPDFEKRRTHIDNLEAQLQGLLKALEGLIKQRKDMGVAALEFGESIETLATAHTGSSLNGKLTTLAAIQKKINDLNVKQARAKCDINYLAATAEDYVRIIGSIRNAFASRAKYYGLLQLAETNLQKKNDALEKLRSASRTRSDKIAVVQTEIEEATKQVEAAKKEFDDVSSRLREELDRFDKEKVTEFAASMKGFLRSLLETQKEVVAAWQSYFDESQPTQE
ncbi:Vacuolar protein sorting-associated protein 5 [Rhizophlyctis rosea]|nr:Vacuolar protein sorting-associated protein 5 [Rhizophlyctis rosea]